MIALTRDPIDTAAILQQVQHRHAGAVCLFLGTVREVTDNEVTVALSYEAYPPMAEAKLREVEAELRAKWPVQEAALVHRLGRLIVGEISVAVAVCAPHRAEAFEACRYGIDRLKVLVPIWKHDTAADGQQHWVDGHTPHSGEAP
jgi:molybdopterin synthase catalytic subunit